MRRRRQRLFYAPLWPRGAIAAALVVVIVVCFVLATPDRWLVLGILFGACFAFGWSALPMIAPKVAVAPQGIKVEGVPVAWDDIARIVLVRDQRSITFLTHGGAPIQLSLPRLRAPLDELYDAIREHFDGVELHDRTPSGWRYAD